MYPDYLLLVNLFAPLLCPQEVFLKAVSVSSTLGCLTALQVAQLMVSMFPFPAPMLRLAHEVAGLWEQQQKKQLAAAVAAAASHRKPRYGKRGHKHCN